MEVETISRIESIEATSWNACNVHRYPFMRHEFLAAMEHSGSVSATSGWLPRHQILKDHSKIVGVMPIYAKTHSWGEYVFDQDWARAYQHHRVPYYPKLLTAAPFTPATGPRWGVLDSVDYLSGITQLLDTLISNAEHQHISSWHCLFPGDSHGKALEDYGLLKRVGCQFHWFNRDFTSFDDFLGLFASRKRKNVRKERKAVHDMGFRFLRKLGHEMSSDDWARFYEFYASTYFKRGHSPHLNLSFFESVGSSLGDAIVVDWVFSPLNNEPIAAALFFFDNDTLYGRYWGCRQEIDGLHFEVCFYRGIEFAIEKGLQRFDPGAQGEHKISRGFEPIETSSYHWIAHPGFRDAIASFLNDEAKYMQQYCDAAAERLPFRKA